MTSLILSLLQVFSNAWLASLAMTMTLAPAVLRVSAFLAATAPAPTTTMRLPASSRYIGYLAMIYDYTSVGHGRATILLVNEAVGG